MTIYIAEFFGTLVLILLGDGVVANVVLRKTKGHGDGWVAITVGWGMAVAIAVYSVGWVSGAHINPAVSIGLAVIGEFAWAKVPGYVLAQVLGAFAGAPCSSGSATSAIGARPSRRPRSSRCSPRPPRSATVPTTSSPR